MVNFEIVQKFQQQNSRSNRRAILFIILGILFFVFICNATMWAPPKNFPLKSVYTLQYSETISSLAEDLHAKHIIKSEFWFKSFVHFFSPFKHTIIAGAYDMSENQSVWALGYRFLHGDYRLIPVKITVPEGLNSKEITEILHLRLKNFDAERFIKIVKEKKIEGYLFPDTYYFTDGISSEDIITAMTANFNEKILPMKNEIEKFGDFKDVIKMASILEKEARTQETRRTIAGILYKRIKLFMPLQADATLYYLLGKTSNELTVDDLKINSPYNSYVVNGLPPTPIGNPGIEAIKDAITPIQTDYLYFLSDKDGNMHYAKNLDDHLKNISKYLR